MNSLVVLLSVVALATAKPSQLLDGGLLTYSSPIIAAAPAAVSHQSRLDIKSTPAFVATAAVEPLARTIIAEPTLLASPLAIAAPSAISHQSRIDIKSTPAIASTVVAAAPFAYSAPIAAVGPAFVKTAAIAPAIAATGLIKTAEFVPAAIGAPAVPLLLDTPEVLAARAAHFETKALTEAHLIRKRSAPALYSAGISTPLVSTYSTAPLISTYGVSPLTYSAISTPIYAKSLGLHAW